MSTVGRDEEVIRNYIRHQEDEDRRIEHLGYRVRFGCATHGPYCQTSV
jgi:hypothetical protein